MKKNIVTTITAILFLVTCVAGASFAFFADGSVNTANLLLDSSIGGTSYQFTAYSTGNLNMEVTIDKMLSDTVGNAAATSNANLNVSLLSSSDSENTTCTYNVVYVWDSTDVYKDGSNDETLGEGSFEFSIKETTKPLAEVDFSNLTWSLNSNNKYQTTLFTDSISSTSSTSASTKDYYFESSIYNLVSVQHSLNGKSFEGRIIVEDINCTIQTINRLSDAVVALAGGNYTSTLREYVTDLNEYNADATSWYASMGGSGNIYVSYDGDLSSITSPSDIDYNKYYCQNSDNVVNFVNSLPTCQYLQDSSNTSSWSVVNENGYRYEGKDPDNYVNFSGSSYRIIGAFLGSSIGLTGTDASKYFVKLIKTASIYSYGYYWSGSNGNSSNDWSLSTLNTSILNDTYYNSLSQKSLIQSATWYLGGITTVAADYDTIYTNERASTGGYSNSSLTSVTANIGLMYPSDYLYAGLASNCARNTQSNDISSTCYLNDWLFISELGEWTISPMSSTAKSVDHYASLFEESGGSKYAIRPTFYLSANAAYTGTGTASDPYVIS